MLLKNNNKNFNDDQIKENQIEYNINNQLEDNQTDKKGSNHKDYY
jgi:hypothetical protein